MKKILKTNFIDLIAISGVLMVGCTDFEPKLSLKSKPHSFAITMCIDTYDSTTYSKREDVKIPCYGSIQNCKEFAEDLCSEGLFPLQTWIEK